MVNTISKPGNALQCHVALNVIEVKAKTGRGPCQEPITL